MAKWTTDSNYKFTSYKPTPWPRFTEDERVVLLSTYDSTIESIPTVFNNHPLSYNDNKIGIHPQIYLNILNQRKKDLKDFLLEMRCLEFIVKTNIKTSCAG